MTTPDRAALSTMSRRQQEAIFLINEALHTRSDKADVDRALIDFALDLRNILMITEDEPVYVGVLA